jgi:hypothetical protein
MAEIDFKAAWHECAHLAWNWKESTPRRVCKQDHLEGTPCTWEIAEDEYQIQCETCGHYLFGPMPPMGFAMPVWKCPTCDNFFAGFDVPKWGLVPGKPGPDGRFEWEEQKPYVEIPTPQKAPHEKWLGK